MNLTTPINLSLAAPAYNESEGIQDVILSWYHYLHNHPDIAQFEIVICNDGSLDKTGVILDELAQQYPEIRPLHFTKNRGAAAALTTAIAATQMNWVLLIDADGQFPIENFSTLLERLRQTGAEAVIGIREKKDQFYLRLGSKISGQICNFVHGTNIKDFNSALKLVKGTLLRSLILESKGMNYSTEITSRLLEHKVNLAEVDIEHRTRTMGKSSMKLVRGSIHRFLFVFYISLRQFLFKIGVLKPPYL